MSDFEKLVRPFESGEVTPDRTFYAPGQPVPANLFLRIGRSGGGSPKTLGTSHSANRTNYMTQYVNEKRNANWGTNR